MCKEKSHVILLVQCTAVGVQVGGPQRQECEQHPESEMQPEERREESVQSHWGQGGMIFLGEGSRD